MQKYYTVTQDSTFTPNPDAKEPSLAKYMVSIEGKPILAAYLYPCGGWWVVQTAPHDNPLIPRTKGQGNTWNRSVKNLPKFIREFMELNHVDIIL